MIEGQQRKEGTIIRTIAQKMGIKNDIKAIFINAPNDIIDMIGSPNIKAVNELKGDFDLIHFFVKDQSTLKEKFPSLRSCLKANGMLWISWPKAGQLGTDLNLKKIISIGYSFGLVESTTLSVDHVWSAIKFTHPKKGKIYKNSYGDLRTDDRY